MLQLKIDTTALHKHALRLERINRKAFPDAIRNTLNSAAFGMKKKTLPDTANKEFINRSPSFFKATSSVKKAEGNNVNKMKAMVGFKGKGTAAQSVANLEQQEHGGTVGHKAFIPLSHARSGKSWNKNVKMKFRLSGIRKSIIDSENSQGISSKEQYTKAAIHAGKGGFMIGNNRKGGNRTVFYINSVKRLKEERRTVANVTPIYSVQAGRTVKPKATHFAEKAANEAGKEMIKIFEKQVAAQIKRHGK